MSKNRVLTLGATAALALATASGCVASTSNSPGAESTWPAPAPVSVSTIDWGTTLQSEAAPEGTRLSYVCPPNGSANSVWGTDMYSDDSSICTAAAHAGLVTFDGGTVNLVVQPGQSAYAESTRNGITSMSYGAWGRSFSFIP